MNNPMAQSEPVEQRFGAPTASEATDSPAPTSAACPLTDVIERQAQSILSTVTDEVQINWVWMPPWGPDRITSDGREQLRAIGFNV